MFKPAHINLLRFIPSKKRWATSTKQIVTHSSPFPASSSCYPLLPAPKTKQAISKLTSYTGSISSVDAMKCSNCTGRHCDRAFLNLYLMSCIMLRTTRHTTLKMLTESWTSSLYVISPISATKKGLKHARWPSMHY